MIKIISLMPKEVQTRFKILKVLSDRRSKMNDEFEDEIKALEKRMEDKKKPIFEIRRKIIAGEEKNFTDYKTKFDETKSKLEKECAEIVTKKPADDKQPEEITPVDVENLKGKDGIPDFWFRAIKNNQMIYELVKEKDEEILKHIKHIDSERSDNPKTLTVKFTFNENEFFDNTELSLKVIYKDDGDQVEKIEGSDIKWKEGKDVTKKKVKKK